MEVGGPCIRVASVCLNFGASTFVFLCFAFCDFACDCIFHVRWECGIGERAVRSITRMDWSRPYGVGPWEKVDGKPDRPKTQHWSRQERRSFTSIQCTFFTIQYFLSLSCFGHLLEALPFSPPFVCRYFHSAGWLRCSFGSFRRCHHLHHPLYVKAQHPFS
jgi:hypothetical protein